VSESLRSIRLKEDNVDASLLFGDVAWSAGNREGRKG
jgi:hypothetical protein